MSSTWSGMKWVWNERSFAHGQPARWLSAGHDRYKSWAIVESLLVFGGSLIPLLSLSNIANAQRGTVVKRKRQGERESERKGVRVCTCMRSSERFEGRRRGRGEGSLDSDGYPVPIYTHRRRKGTRRSTMVLVNTGKEWGKEKSPMV